MNVGIRCPRSRRDLMLPMLLAPATGDGCRIHSVGPLYIARYKSTKRMIRMMTMRAGSSTISEFGLFALWTAWIAHAAFLMTHQPALRVATVKRAFECTDGPF